MGASEFAAFLATLLLVGSNPVLSMSREVVQEDLKDAKLTLPKEFCLESKELSAEKVVDGKLPFCTPKPCSGGPHLSVLTAAGNKKVSFFPYCRLSWDEAQKECWSQLGGRLWEPTSQAEYDHVFNAIGFSSSTQVPEWFYKPKIHYWIGFKNGDGDGSNAIHASNGNVGFKALTESWPPGDDCVDIFGSGLYWGDHQCHKEYPFICEAPVKNDEPECTCKYQKKEFKCGQIVGSFPNCCMQIYCDKEGGIQLIQEKNELGFVKSGCCGDPGQKFGLLQPGHTYKDELVCCEGSLIKMNSGK